jgi:hypothetical protein
VSGDRIARSLAMVAMDGDVEVVPSFAEIWNSSDEAVARDLYVEAYVTEIEATKCSSLVKLLSQVHPLAASKPSFVNGSDAGWIDLSHLKRVRKVPIIEDSLSVQGEENGIKDGA